jgi:hypothetical protein
VFALLPTLLRVPAVVLSLAGTSIASQKVLIVRGKRIVILPSRTPGLVPIPIAMLVPSVVIAIAVRASHSTTSAAKRLVSLLRVVLEDSRVVTIDRIGQAI